MSTEPSMIWPDLAELREQISAITQQELCRVRASMNVQRKPDGSLVTAADIALQKRLQHFLQQRWPYPVLGEELTVAEQTEILQNNSVLWCLDPIDGTSNFTAGLPYFGVSLALLVEGMPQLALVYDPMRDECFTARKGQGACLNGQPLAPDTERQDLANTLALIDFKRLSSELLTRLVQQPPYASQRSFGASALDWCWLAAGRCQIYLHGKQMLWDYAAGSLVLAETGGQAMTLDGEPVCQLSLNTRSVVAASNRWLFQQWAAWLGFDALQTEGS
jgi:myo-inositol-1(or 4)-monophosphatase